MEKAGKGASHVPTLAGDTEGGADLAQHLMLPHYHRVQAAGDPKEVSGAVLVMVLVNMRVQITPRHSGAGGQKLAQPVNQVSIVVIVGVDL
jgi:hypothetical protein